ncbi:F420-nonreducing hydrogenase [candidate division KSB1 bacterium]
MSDKITVATTWLQGCSGCHISLLDLHEELFDLLEIIDLKYSTIFDVKEVPRVDVGIIEGAVGNEENEELLKTFRERCDKLIALGTCASFGGISGLRNIHKKADVLYTGYVDTASTVDGVVPSGKDIPALCKNVRALSQVVEIDYIIPGCPPLPSMIKDALVAISNGEKPVLPTKNLCDECSREKEQMLIPKRDFVTDHVDSPHELDEINPDRCFLDQGVLCMGPATAAGCDARCLKGNMPCRGCMGPTPSALEQGAKIINAVSSILPAGALMFQEDIVGTGYRYSLPVSIFPELADERSSTDE